MSVRTVNDFRPKIGKIGRKTERLDENEKIMKINIVKHSKYVGI